MHLLLACFFITDVPSQISDMRGVLQEKCILIEQLLEFEEEAGFMLELLIPVHVQCVTRRK